MDVKIDIGMIINSLVLAGLVFLFKLIFQLRDNVREVKSALGLNGNPERGLLYEVKVLRVKMHKHAGILMRILTTMHLAEPDDDLDKE